MSNSESKQSSRHNDAISAAKTEMMAFYEDVESNFQFKHETNGVKVSTYSPLGSSVPIIRGHMLTEVSVADMTRVFNCLPIRDQWDEGIEGWKIIESSFDGWTLAHTQQRGLWPVVSGRDFCAVSELSYNGSSTVIVQTSVTDPLVPEDKKRVRAHLHGSLFIAKPSIVKPGWNEITYIVYVDLKGSIPAPAVKMVVTNIPLCLYRIEHLIKTQGVPMNPLALPQNRPGFRIKIDNGKISGASNEGNELSITAMEGPTNDAMIFKIDPKIWPHGVSIEWDGHGLHFEKSSEFEVKMTATAAGPMRLMLKPCQVGPPGQMVLVH
jgi:hypothetical protein